MAPFILYTTRPDGSHSIAVNCRSASVMYGMFARECALCHPGESVAVLRWDEDAADYVPFLG